MIKSKTIICLPGLGGHQTSFKGYEKIFADFKIVFTEIVNPEKSFQNIKTICLEQDGSIMLLANCYGAQLGLRLVQELPSKKIEGMIIIEPFFAQFHWWRWPGLFAVRLMLAVLFVATHLGIRRRHLWENIDYAYLARYPISVQPIFDMRWQNLPDYFRKIDDILTFHLPKDLVHIPALLIFSSEGFMRDINHQERVARIFCQTSTQEVSVKSHNIITLAQKEIGEIILDWFSKNPECHQ